MIDKNNFEEAPEINLKMESVDVKSNMKYIPWVTATTPYMMLTDKNGTHRVWTKSKKKIIYYYAYQITKIKWFLRKYQE